MPTAGIQKHLNKGLGFKANLEVQGLGFKVYGLGFGVFGLGFVG